MNSRKKAPDLARHGGLQKHHNYTHIIRHQIDQTKFQRQKTLGIFRRRMADRIRVAKAAGSPLLDEWIRFRDIQLWEWQPEAEPAPTGGRSIPERGLNCFSSETIPQGLRERKPWINKQGSTLGQRYDRT